MLVSLVSNPKTLFRSIERLRTNVEEEGPESVPITVKGGTFTPQQRLDAKSIIEGIVSEREKALEPTLNVYRNLNTEMGGKAEAIINPYDAVRKSTAPTDLASQAKAELERRRKK